MNELTAISIFSGGGGLDLGIAYAGFRTKVAVECEKFACATLRRAQSAKVKLAPGHFYLDGATIIEGDIRQVTSEQILDAAGLAPGETSLLVGGPPCVTFSVAGKRKGLQHETGQLYEEYVRVLRDTQPQAFIFENVKGLLTAPGRDGRRGGAFSEILLELKEAGYTLTWRVVNAADYGVPQHRHRVLILGRRGSRPIIFPDATHFPPQKGDAPAALGQARQWKTVRDAIGDLPRPALPCEEPSVPNHVARSHTAKVIESLAATPQGQRNQMYKRDRLRWDEPAKAIRAQGKPKPDGSGQKNSSHQSIHPDEHRQITVRESARIQTFPDWYVFDSTFVNGYRVVGDAVPPDLARVVATAIRDQVFPATTRVRRPLAVAS